MIPINTQANQRQGRKNIDNRGIAKEMGGALTSDDHTGLEVTFFGYQI